MEKGKRPVKKGSGKISNTLAVKRQYAISEDSGGDEYGNQKNELDKITGQLALVNLFIDFDEVKQEFYIQDIKSHYQPGEYFGRQIIKGENIRELFGNKAGDELIKLLIRAKSSGNSQHCKIPFTSEKKTDINPECHIFKISENSFLVNFFDSSHFFRHYDRLKETSEKYKHLRENVPIGLFKSTPSGEILYSNNWLAKILGYRSPAELLKLNFNDLIVGNQNFNDLFNHVNSSGSLPPSEVLLAKKDKKEIWSVISADKVFDNETETFVYEGFLYDITRRKQALDKLNKNEQSFKSLYTLFRLMADNVVDMFWAKDLNNRYLFANKALCDNLLMAKDTTEPIGKNDLFFAERERKKFPDNPGWHTFGEICQDSDSIVLKNKKFQKFDEFGNVKGEFLFLEVFKTPLLDENGRIIGTVGSARDVTRQRQADIERKRDEKLKNVVYRISNAVSTTKDLDELFTVIRLELSQVIDTTNLFIALYDSESDEISFPYFKDEKDRFKKIMAKNSLTQYMIRRGKPLLMKESDFTLLEAQKEIEIIGSVAKVWLGVPLKFKSEIIGAIVVQNYDDPEAFSEKDLDLMNFVSTQISISIQQKRADDALRDSEFRLRQIIDTVPHMIFVKNRDSRFIMANKALADSYGLRVEEIEGKKHKELHQIKSEIDQISNDDEYVFSTGNIRIKENDKFTDINGEEHILQIIRIPVKTGIDKDNTVLSVAIDVTDRRTSEIELKHAKNKAEESDRLKTAFLANMSHEIRTPMNAIVGFSELLNDPELTVSDRKEFVRLISENSRVLLHLIEDIIDVAKIEAEQLKLVQSKCMVNQIIDETVAYFKNLLKKQEYKNIEIRVKKGNENNNFTIITDPLRFKQVMNNLVGNAIKFTDKGYVEIGYQIRTDNVLQFYIEDTGIGLPPDKMNVIFERFRQAEESSTKEYGGTGLGLTISRRLIELLGGTIWVESILHEGSTFYFTLPLIIANDAQIIKPFAKQTEINKMTGKFILVAEDENSNFELIKAMLQSTRANIIRANNGKEAIEICRKNNNISLILMDIRMPEMNGYIATKLIKEFKPSLPVISLTAYAMADDREKSIQAGCDDYISKPINPQELLEKIMKLIT